MEGSGPDMPEFDAGHNLGKSRGLRNHCNETLPSIVLAVRTHEREPMLKKKTISVVVTAGAIALGYAVVSTNAFADTSATPTSTVSATSTATPQGIAAGVSAQTSAQGGIQAPLGLQTSPLSTMPSIGDDDGDDQSDDSIIDDDGDDDGDLSASVGVSISASDDNGSGQDGTDSDD